MTSGSEPSSRKEKVSELAEAAKQKVGDLKSQAAETVSELTETVREEAAELGDRVERGTRRARLGFWQLMEERPLVVGAAAFAVGLLAGLAVPRTEAEDELLGEKRDRLLERAQEEGLTPDKLAEKVRHVAEETTETVKNEASQEASVPAEVHEPELARR